MHFVQVLNEGRRGLGDRYGKGTFAARDGLVIVRLAIVRQTSRNLVVLETMEKVHLQK